MLHTRNYEGIIEASHRSTTTTLGMAAGDVFHGTMDKVQAHDEETQGSGSGSGFSDISALENETDEFGRRLLQHQRDAQRMNALRSDQQAFRKARPRVRVAEALEREDRERERSAGQNHPRIGSEGSNESEPPVTVPREWGRRARRQTDWMRKILEPSETSENAEGLVERDVNAIIPRRTRYSGDLDWEAEDEPLQSVEDTPPSMRRKRLSTPPSSMRHMNTTLKNNTDFDDGDFTAADLLASTPAVTPRTQKIDELTWREIQNVERERVTTRTLGEIAERSPNGALRRSSSSRIRERAIAEAMATNASSIPRPVTATGNSRSPTRLPRRLRSPQRLKENVPPNGEVNMNGSPSKGSATVGLTNHAAQAVNTQKNPQRPKHHRNDSMSLLRKLARVSSMSPSPANERKKSDTVARERKTSADDPGPLSAKTTNSDCVADSRPPTQDAKEDDWGFGDLLHNKQSEAVNNAETEPKGATVDEDVDMTPMPQDQAQEAKTPVVTGAWVDTTLQTESTSPVFQTIAKADPNSLSNSIKEAFKLSARTSAHDLRRINSEPAKPKSALEAILRETRNQQNDQTLGESTIQSLEDIAHPQFDLTDPTITFDADSADAPAEALSGGRALTQLEKDRRQEDLAMEGLNKHLKAARASIKDANRGLRRVENRIETVQEEVPVLRTTSTTSTNSTTKATTITTNASDGLCATCGRVHGSLWYGLWSEFRSCFYVYDSRSKYLGVPIGIRFTWLGLACIFWLLWYISESVLCGFYCHPNYTWYARNISPNAPRYPFVIPTLILRPFRFLWGPAWDFVFEAFGLAWWEEFLEDITRPAAFGGPVGPPYGKYKYMTSNSRRTDTGLGLGKATVRRAFESVVPTVSRNEWVATATTTSARVVRSVVDAVDEVGSMWDDEFVS
ncbi:hypothetical protein LTR37_010078 [Vermiconidia calcicola]|uniref:Uncharacterized protein n=1 Tax=Vermiconidia calcicola TaxID=1690605 RepID=A0ACC3N650_9PEZI|nr:hypothetical protein LTR37_010078 [Vermiconidia calcicola]